MPFLVPGRARVASRHKQVAAWVRHQQRAQWHTDDENVSLLAVELKVPTTWPQGAAEGPRPEKDPAVELVEIVLYGRTGLELETPGADRSLIADQHGSAVDLNRDRGGPDPSEQLFLPCTLEKAPHRH
jgi:hypothetical protein